MEDADIAAVLPARDPGGNKWAAAVLVVAGSPGMTGAAALCAAAAYRAGSGMVRLGVPGGDARRLPATEAVGVDLPGDGWADVGPARWRHGAVPWWWVPGWVGPRATGGEVRWLVARTAGARWWSTPTG